MATVESVPCMMIFTFADGRIQQMGFNIPKGACLEAPTGEIRK